MTSNTLILSRGTEIRYDMTEDELVEALSPSLQLQEIATSLSHTARYNGATESRAVSVAEHSVFCMLAALAVGSPKGILDYNDSSLGRLPPQSRRSLNDHLFELGGVDVTQVFGESDTKKRSRCVVEFALSMLLHDSAEALTGDYPSGYKEHLRTTIPGFGEDLLKHERAIARVMDARYGSMCTVLLDASSLLPDFHLSRLAHWIDTLGLLHDRNAGWVRQLSAQRRAQIQGSIESRLLTGSTVRFWSHLKKDYDEPTGMHGGDLFVFTRKVEEWLSAERGADPEADTLSAPFWAQIFVGCVRALSFALQDNYYDEVFTEVIQLIELARKTHRFAQTEQVKNNQG